MPIYQRAKQEVEDLVRKIREKFHGDLEKAGVTFEVIMVSPMVSKKGVSSGPPLKVRGYPVPAITKTNQIIDRTLGRSDAQIQLDADQWEKFTGEQRAALIDHELEHLKVKKDRDGVTVTDDLDRPILQYMSHDREVGWFNDVVRRQREHAFEFQAFNSMWRSCTQLGLEFVDAIG